MALYNAVEITHTLCVIVYCVTLLNQFKLWKALYQESLRSELNKLGNFIASVKSAMGS